MRLYEFVYEEERRKPERRRDFRSSLSARSFGKWLFPSTGLGSRMLSGHLHVWANVLLPYLIHRYYRNLSSFLSSLEGEEACWAEDARQQPPPGNAATQRERGQSRPAKFDGMRLPVNSNISISVTYAWSCCGMLVVCGHSVCRPLFEVRLGP